MGGAAPSPRRSPLKRAAGEENFGAQEGKIIKNEPIWSRSREAPTSDFQGSSFFSFSTTTTPSAHLCCSCRSRCSTAANQRALMIFDHALRDLLHVFARRRARRAARRQLCSQRERRKAPIRRAAAAYADDDCCLFWAKSPERASESEARVAVSTIFTQLFA